MTVAAPDLSRSRREVILAVASEFFARRGYRATSLAELAAAAGIAKPTLFHYFRSKQQILYELYAQTMEMALGRLAAVGQLQLPPAAALRRMLREHTLLILENRALFTILFDEEQELSEAQLRMIKRKQKRYIELVLDPVRQLQEQGRLRRGIAPKIAVQGLIGMASWVYRWYEADRRLAPHEIASMLAELALGGILEPSVRTEMEETN